MDYPGECCDNPRIVEHWTVHRARANWKHIRLKMRAIAALRVVMLAKSVEAKFTPGGRGAQQASESFEQTVKKHTESFEQTVKKHTESFEQTAKRHAA